MMCDQRVGEPNPYKGPCVCAFDLIAMKYQQNLTMVNSKINRVNSSRHTPCALCQPTPDRGSLEEMETTISSIDIAPTNGALGHGRLVH